jgi:catechol 2,3-dioxygenase-like lactoylglutathione lyase family enzyme
MIIRSSLSQSGMTNSGLHITQLATVVVPVSDQDEALAFYVGVLGMRKVSDFTYESGERWVEVAPPGSSTNLSLVVARPERPAGVETGVAMISADVLADLVDAPRRRRRGGPVAPCPRVRWCGGAAPRRPASRRSSACAIRTATRF